MRALPLLVVPVMLVALGNTAAGGASVDRSAPADAALRPAPTTPALGGTSGVSSQPHDARNYTRSINLQDRIAAPALPAGYVLEDTIVSNSNPNLKNTDTQSDSEPFLAINPANPNEIVITGFSSSWSGNGNAALFRSTNGGSTWTKAFSIPRPTGVTVGSGCPCDQVMDFDRSRRLLGTFLNEAGGSGDVYTGSTTNASSASAWRWKAVSGVAQKTDNPGADNADQPWLRVTRSPSNASLDNAFVAYDDFSARQLRVSVSRAANPPSFVATRAVGVVSCCVNPGTRLAPNHGNGTMYVVYQYALGTNTNGSVRVQYALNRSTDGGSTWSLNGFAQGVVVAEADSNQPTPKFGTVNALLGGVDSVNVDPTTGDVYVVYGIRDPSTGNNRLAIVRLGNNGSGGLKIISNVYMTGQVRAAIPSVAVASNGTIGVLYDTFDGFNAAGFPVFSAHLAQSNNHGLAFSDVKLVAFASPAKDNGDPRQRVLGDYQALRVVGNTFYGTFTANGAQFGRGSSNTDAIFLKAPAK